MKTLYSFKVKKKVKQEVVEGTDAKTAPPSPTEVEIFIKKPSHREIDEMDLFYSIQISELQAKGVATNTMILNNYQDSGGVDSKKEVEAMKRLITELNTKRNLFLKNSVDKIDDPNLLEEIKDLSVQLYEYQNRLASIFDRSAESIAERRLILWSTLHFLFSKENDVFKPFFNGSSYEERLNNYYDMLDDDTQDHSFEQEVFEKGQVFLTSWMKKQAESVEDFQTLESLMNESNATDVAS